MFSVIPKFNTVSNLVLSLAVISYVTLWALAHCILIFRIDLCEEIIINKKRML